MGGNQGEHIILRANPAYQHIPRDLGKADEFGQTVALIVHPAGQPEHLINRLLLEPIRRFPPQPEGLDQKAVDRVRPSRLTA